MSRKIPIPGFAYGVIVSAMAVIGAATAGCERDQRPAGTSELTETTMARSKIVDARCDLEQRCNRIGPGQQDQTREACVQRIHQNWRDELSSSVCTGGVDTKELNECLNEIRNNDCNNPFDSLERVVACRSSDLCKH